jgi:carbonic anhydrase/acetyltransferase-like protein (isoleucine patch superfamily)
MVGRTAKTTSLGNVKIMIYRNSDKSLAVISYETATFFALTKFLAIETTESLTRISPEDFLNSASNQYQYINLVVKDFDLRKKISETLDQHNLERWTLVVEDPAVFSKVAANKNLSIGQGCLIYPGVWVYSGTIGKDVIIHGMVKLAENISVGNGCFFSGSITIAGGCAIGDWCFLGNNLFFIDGIQVCDNVRLLPGTNLRKNITRPGTYYNPNTYRVEKIIL